MNVPRFDPAGHDQDAELKLGQPDRYLTEREVEESWDKAFGLADLKSHEMRGYRTVLAWRLTRALAVLQGRLNMDERLSELPCTNGDWKEMQKPTGPTANLGGPTRRVLKVLDHPAGMALAPNKNDAHNARFTLAVTHLAQGLWMQRGSTKIPQLGYYGLHGLTHENTVQDYWPSTIQILGFEEDLVYQVKGFVIKWSRNRVLRHLKDLLDLGPKEAGGLIAMATYEARTEAMVDVDMKRFLMEERLHDYVDRAREDGESMNELRGLKMLSMVQGLHQAEQENSMDQLVGAMTRVANEQAGSRILRIESPVEDEGTGREEA